jgi:Tryptophan 2,3-dioxygenase
MSQKQQALGGPAQKVVVGEATAAGLEGSQPPPLDEAVAASRVMTLRRDILRGLEAQLALAKDGGEEGGQGEDVASLEGKVKEAAAFLPPRTMNYHDYLRLDDVLAAQVPESGLGGKRAAHDEMLFIIVHQAFELWFKQIAHELTAVTEVLQQPVVPENHIGRCVHLLNRVIQILKLMVRLQVSGVSLPP